jgi:hypothetical protein
MFLGGVIPLIGAGISLAKSIKQRNEASKQRDIEAQERRKQAQMLKEQNDLSVFNAFPSKGFENVQFFGYGGKIKNTMAKGGTIVPIADNVGEVVGDTHAEDSDRDGMTGVSLLNGKVEVEDQEIIKGNKVFSDRIGPTPSVSYARAAELIASTGKYKKFAKQREKDTEIVDDIKNPQKNINSSRRRIETIKDPLDTLFEMQESQKAIEEAEAQNNQGAPQQMAFGGEFDFNDVVPFLDNITNSMLTDDTPNIPRPILTEAPRLKTDFNINPQIEEMRRSSGATKVALERSGLGANRVAANMAAVRAADISGRNQLMGQKENVETQLKNQQSVLDNQNMKENAGKLSKYRYDKMLRDDDIAGRRSANVSNFVEDVQFNEAQKIAEETNQQEFFLTLMKYNESGVLSRAKVAQAMDGIRKGMTAAEALELALKDTDDVDEAERKDLKGPLKSLNTRGPGRVSTKTQVSQLLQLLNQIPN